MDFMEEHLAENVSLNVLADLVRLSPSLLSRSRHHSRSSCGPGSHRPDADPALAAEQRPAACLAGTAPFPRLRRLNLPQNPDKTLYIRQLENGLERPGGGLRPTTPRLASLVGIDAFTGALRRGIL